MSFKKPVFATTALMFLSLTGMVHAATFVVDRFDDTAAAAACTAAANDCSLRGAIITANASIGVADVITLPAGTYNLSVAATGCDLDFAGTNGDLDITNGDLTINGAGAGTTIIDGGDIDRVFDMPVITTASNVIISAVTIRNGTPQIGTSVCTPGGDGGGARVSQGSLTLNDVVVSGNDAVNGGGIRNSATLTVNRSTISGNRATLNAGGDGGGLSSSGGTSTLVNSTVSGNTATANGGGVASGGGTRLRNVTITANTAGDDGGGLFHTSDSGSINVRNTIIAGNSDTAGGNTPDCGQQFPGGAGVVTSEGFNLIGDDEGCGNFATASGDQVGTLASPIDPLIGPLANNGGPTPTHLPLTGSRAIDLANSAGCFSNDANSGSPLAVDQRSFTRPLDGDRDGGVRCDVGAVEVGCGNGVVETDEGCDDGNTTAGDGCNATCALESCGDGVVQSPEGCDDGNTANGDGCNANCILETCGNGTVDAGEDCDDGNSVNTDACTNACRNGVCGDGFVETGSEQCDDGNTKDGDSCSSTCTNVILLLGDGGCSLIRAH